MSPGTTPGSARETTGGRPLRADAQRNRTRILDAADAVFAASGPSASTEEVAQWADVAIGTVFRHFPTKEALIEAVTVGRLRRLAEQARSLASAAEPGEAFLGFFAEAVRQATAKHAFVSASADAGVDLLASQGVAAAVQELRQGIDDLLARAQRVAAVRDDVDGHTLIALMVGASRAVDYAGQDAEAGDRTLTVILDGLRPA